MDNILTARIGIFLKKDTPTDKEIIEAATMLLSLDPGRERGIYNSTLRRPQSLLPWVRADLKKFYDNRKRGMDNLEAQRFNAETVKLVVEDLKQVPEDAEAPKEKVSVVTTVRGKRTDHNTLPDNIKQLWENNVKRWKRISELHAQLAAMVAKPDYQSCDGNELCYQLRQADNALRKDYDRYDSYKIPDGTETHEETAEEKAQRIMKQIQSARTTISRTLKKNQLADKDVDKLQTAVNTLADNNAEIKDETIEKLKAAGVTIPESDEQGKENQ